MNEKQAQAVVELATDGFPREALVLAKAYNEKLAAPHVIAFVKSLFQSIFGRFWGKGAAQFFVRLAKGLYGQELTSTELDEAIARTKRLFVGALAVLALSSFLVFLYMMLSYHQRRNQVIQNIEAAQQALKDALRDFNAELQRLLKDKPEQKPEQP
jgi:hypothetical protein